MDDEGERLSIDAFSWVYFPVWPKWNHRHQGLIGIEAIVSVLIGVELCNEDFLGILDHCEYWILPLLLKGPDEGPQYSLSIHFGVLEA